jgi:glycerophosphoryl diester phosphodiesterase
MLQAHRGVSTDCPENTMAAFREAVKQGYDIIEFDPKFTKDNVCVALHDRTLNRTAAGAGDIAIKDITYAEAQKYEYGSWFAPEYKGEAIPLLEDALQFAAQHHTPVKIDNKIERFPKEITEKLYDLFKKYESNLCLTTGKTEMIRFYAEQFPSAQLHYDGPVDAAVLEELAPFAGRLTVWLPYRCPLTSWVKVPFADEALCAAVKEIASLGIWLINDEESHDDVCARFSPDIVETTGTIKP